MFNSNPRPDEVDLRVSPDADTELALWADSADWVTLVPNQAEIAADTRRSTIGGGGELSPGPSLATDKPIAASLGA